MRKLPIVFKRVICTSSASLRHWEYQKAFILFYFITIANICKRKHFAPKLLISVYNQYQPQA